MEVIHLSQSDLAKRWGISEASLERWRCEGIGPVYLKLTGRIRYRLCDIESYEESCLSKFVGRTISSGGCSEIAPAK